MSLFIARSEQVCNYAVWGKRRVSSHYSQRYTCLPLSITRDVPRTQFSALQYGLRIASGANPRSKPCPKGRYTLSVKLSDFMCYVIPDGKKWVNCAVLTGSSACLRTVLSSRFSHRELRSSLRESHSFLSLPADTIHSQIAYTIFDIRF